MHKNSKTREAQTSGRAMSDLLDAALCYARDGRAVLPLHTPIFSGTVRCSCGAPDCGKNIGKHPRIARGCHAADRDPDEIRRWWRRWPDANLGLATGTPSGIFVVDVDPRHGGDQALCDLEQEHGPIPPTWRFLTGGGGEHILFNYPSGERLGNSAGRLGDGLDARGEGGFIVAPPSLHANGRRYAISVDHHPDEVPLAEPPAWLLALLKEPATMGGAAPGVWRDRVSQQVREGQRNQAVARLAGHLLRRYVDPLVAHDLVQAWNKAQCVPPLDPGEVTRTVASISRSELRRRKARHGRL